MATRKDIVADTQNEAMVFFCKGCRSEFHRIPAKQVFTLQAQGTLQQEADRIIDDHLATCTATTSNH